MGQASWRSPLASVRSHFWLQGRWATGPSRDHFHCKTTLLRFLVGMSRTSSDCSIWRDKAGWESVDWAYQNLHRLLQVLVNGEYFLSRLQYASQYHHHYSKCSSCSVILQACGRCWIDPHTSLTSGVHCYLSCLRCKYLCHAQPTLLEHHRGHISQLSRKHSGHPNPSCWYQS